MVRRSKISQLPEELQAWLRTELKDRGFQDYDEVAEALNDRIAAAGIEMTVSRAGVGREAKEYQAYLEEIRESRDFALYVAEQLPDDDGRMNQALVRMAQDKMFRILRELSREELDPKKIGMLTRAVADITRASISDLRWTAEVVKKRAEAAAAKVGERLKKSGVGKETQDIIYRDILNIAVEGK